MSKTDPKTINGDGKHRIVMARKTFNDRSKNERLKWIETKEKNERVYMRQAKDEEIKRINQQLSLLRDEYTMIMAENGFAHKAAQLINDQENEINEYAKRLESAVNIRAQKTLLMQQKDNYERDERMRNEKQKKRDMRKLIMKGESSKLRDLDYDERELRKKLQRLELMKRNILDAIRAKNDTVHLVKDYQRIKGKDRKTIKNDQKLKDEHKKKSVKFSIDTREKEKSKAIPTVPKVVEHQRPDLKILKSDVMCQTTIIDEPHHHFHNKPLDLPLTIASKVIQKLYSREALDNYKKNLNLNADKRVFRNVAVNTTPKKSEVSVSNVSKNGKTDVQTNGSISSTETSYHSLPVNYKQSNSIVKTLNGIQLNNFTQKSVSFDNVSNSSKSSSAVEIGSENVSVSNDNDEILYPLLNKIRHLKNMIDQQIEINQNIEDVNVPHSSTNLLENVHSGVKNKVFPSHELSTIQEVDSDSRHNTKERTAKTVNAGQIRNLQSKDINCQSTGENGNSSSSFKTLPAVSINMTLLNGTSLNETKETNERIQSLSSNDSIPIHELCIRESSPNESQKSFDSNVSLSAYERELNLFDRNKFWNDVFLRARINRSAFAGVLNSEEVSQSNTAAPHTSLYHLNRQSTPKLSIKTRKVSLHDPEDPKLTMSGRE